MRKSILVIVAVLAIVLLNFTGFTQENPKKNVLPKAKGVQTGEIIYTPANPYGEGKTSSHYEWEIANWRDPFTLPHSKTDCCEIKCIPSPFGEICGCVRWCTQYQWMYVHAIVIVDINPPGDIWGSVKQCNDIAVGAGLVAGIVTAWLTSGSSGAATAVAVYLESFANCLRSKITQNLLNARIEFRSNWGEWE